ncbi:carbon-nitrogen family hydrolase [Thiomicrorhabdus hydrogeniphila]
MNIVALQWQAIWQDSSANLALLKQSIDRLMNPSQIVAQNKPDVIVLPEIFHGGFSMQPSYFAESIEGDVSQCLMRLAQQYQCNIVAGVAQKTVRSNCQGKQVTYYNTALAFDKTGQNIGRYIKQKPFSFAQEQAVYEPGYKPQIIQINNEPFALFVCYDLRFPELFRQVAKKVKGIIVIANWPAQRQMHWEVLLKARAIENQCFMIGVNRIGQDGNNLDYLGGSMVISPLGEVIAYANETADILWANIDLKQTNQIRHQFPFLDDMTDGFK